MVENLLSKIYIEGAPMSKSRIAFTSQFLQCCIMHVYDRWPMQLPRLPEHNTYLIHFQPLCILLPSVSVINEQM